MSSVAPGVDTHAGLHPDIYAAAELAAAGGLRVGSTIATVREGAPESTGDKASSIERLPEDEKALVEVLYPWYLNATELDAPAGSLRPFELDLPAALRAAHRDSARFEGGWRAERVSTWGRVVARKGDLERFLDRSEYLVPGRPGLRAQPGAAIIASRCWSWVDEKTGFWHVRRGAWPPEGANRLVRIYWNVGPEAAPHLLHELSAVLAGAPGASYMAKTPARPEHSGRADAFVLYLGPQGFEALEAGIRDLAGRLAGTLRPAAPRFTLRLAAGVALAEGDLDGESFGEARCRLVARAYLEADTDERRSAAALVDRIAAAFTAAGLDPRRPHLEPEAARRSKARSGPDAQGDSGDRSRPETEHDLESQQKPKFQRAPTPSANRDHGVDREPNVELKPGAAMPAEPTATDPLVMAQAIARRLCNEAVWDGDRAIWLGDEKEEVAGNWEVVHKSLGGDLYGGSAGIGLFLTRLWRVTGEDRNRTTALGAFAHAAEWHRRSRPPGSLYSGSAGVAAALAEGAATFDSDEFREVARAIALDAVEDLPPVENDLIAGRGGSIIALLALSRGLDMPEAGAAALQLGRDLAEVAQETPEGGAAWLSDIGADEPALCGLAHGASGPALALGELAQWESSESGHFAALAAAAARYERSWYDREQENWPDLRELTRVGLARGETPASPLYWCHGAVGIGLVRLRQFERTGSTMAAVEAGAALQAAEKYLALRADDLRADLSQCHGVAALAELFLEGARVFGQPALRQLAGDCVELAAAASGHGAGPWPCGVPEGGENPSLMLGLAGIGMMFLRCADPTVAPVGLLYTEPIMRKRVIVKLKGQTTTEGLSRRAGELSEMVPGSRVERFSRSGRVLLRLPDDASTADAIERLDRLQDVVYAEADVIDSAQDS